MSGRRPACPPHSSSAKSDFPVTKLPFRSSTSSALAWFGRIGGEVRDHVEVDETWVGGGTRGKGRGVHDKLLVAGAVEVRVRKPGTKLDERKGRRYAGRVRLAVVPDRSAESLAMSPLPLTPSLTRAIGSTLNVVVVGDNRIGMVHSLPASGISRAHNLNTAGIKPAPATTKINIPDKDVTYHLLK